MKNNKGFTLIELLAIIVILGIIIAIAAPNLTKEIKKNEEINNNILNEKIENAAHIYAAKYHSKDIIDKNYSSVEFSLDSLIKDGLLSFKNGVCDSVLTNNIKMTSTGKYNYKNISSNCYKCSYASRDNVCE